MVLRFSGKIAFLFLFLALLSCGNEQKSASFSSTSLPDGEKLYFQNCAACHGGDGSLGASGSKDLTMSTLEFDSIRHVILEGREGMPKFEGILQNEEEVKAVTEFTVTLKKN